MSNSRKQKNKNQIVLKQESKDCQICEAKTKQIKILLASLKNKLTVYIKNRPEEYEEKEQRVFNTPQKVFSGLLNIIFGDMTALNGGNEFCSHGKIFKNLRRKLRCTQAILKQACQSISLEIGSRNYHSWLLGQQIQQISLRLEKKLSDQFNEESMFYLKENYKGKKKLGRKKLTQKTVKENYLKEQIIKKEEMLENGLIKEKEVLKKETIRREQEQFELERPADKRAEESQIQNHPTYWTFPYFLPFFPPQKDS